MKKSMAKYIVIAGVVSGSFSSIFGKFSNSPSVILVLYRMAISSVLLFPLILTKYRDEFKHLNWKQVTASVISGICFAVHLALFFESLKFTSITSASLLASSEVLFVALVTVVFFHEKIPVKGWIGIVVAFTGMVILSSGDKQAGADMFYGDVLGILSAIVVTAYTLIGKKVRKTVSTNVYTFLLYTSSTVTLLIMAFVMRIDLFGYDVINVWMALLLAVFCTLLSHSVFSWGLKFCSAAFVSTAKLLTPVFAAILGIFFFGQLPRIEQIIGGVIVLIGLAFYISVKEA